MGGWHGAVVRGITALAMGCALRPKEFRKSHVIDLNLSKMKFFVRHPKGEGSWGAQEEGDIVRAEVVPLLIRYLDERKEHLNAIGIERAIALPPNNWRKKDEFFSANSFNEIKCEVKEIAGVSFRLKDFRSTCAYDHERGPISTPSDELAAEAYEPNNNAVVLCRDRA